MYTIIYYSPTGNTKYLANSLAEKLKLNSDNIYSLEDINPSTLNFENELILMYPIHGFNPPRTVIRFIKNFASSSKKTVHLLAVGCNDLFINDATNVNVRRYLKKKGFLIGIDEIFIMPLTIVLKMPDKYLPKMLEEADSKLNIVVRNIQNKNYNKRNISFGGRIFHTFGKLESPAARLFGLELHAKKNCTSCKLCWNNCPEDNIKEGKNGRPKFKFKCSMCMRCIYDCPVKVIRPRFSKFIPMKGGYDSSKLEDIKNIKK